MFDKIDMVEIGQEIDKMPIISDIRKKFYKKLLNGRYDVIVKNSYDKLMENKEWNNL